MKTWRIVKKKASAVWLPARDFMVRNTTSYWWDLDMFSKEEEAFE